MGLTLIWLAAMLSLCTPITPKPISSRGDVKSRIYRMARAYSRTVTPSFEQWERTQNPCAGLSYMSLRSCHGRRSTVALCGMGNDSTMRHGILWYGLATMAAKHSNCSQTYWPWATAIAESDSGLANCWLSKTVGGFTDATSFRKKATASCNGIGYAVRVEQRVSAKGIEAASRLVSCPEGVTGLGLGKGRGSREFRICKKEYVQNC